ncbi:MAG: hypothetical protein ACRCTY_00500, partial [Candidatus Adiutrix sp.]
MKPLTELDLRMALKDINPSVYEVTEGVVITPSAAEYLRQRRIELVFKKKEDAMTLVPNNYGRLSDSASKAPETKKQEKPAPKWDFTDPKERGHSHPGEKPKQLFFGPDGGTFDHKPEAFTH